MLGVLLEVLLVVLRLLRLLRFLLFVAEFARTNLWIQWKKLFHQKSANQRPK